MGVTWRGASSAGERGPVHVQVESGFGKETTLLQKEVRQEAGSPHTGAFRGASPDREALIKSER